MGGSNVVVLTVLSSSKDVALVVSKGGQQETNLVLDRSGSQQRFLNFRLRGFFNAYPMGLPSFICEGRRYQ
jgi:hypothetical protein